MKLQYFALPTFALLASVVADDWPPTPEAKDINDCFWAFPYSKNIEANCPPPKKKGDVFTTSTLKPGDCIALVDGQIHPGDNGKAFKTDTLDLKDCKVNREKKQFECGKHGHILFTNLASLNSTGEGTHRYNEVSCFDHGISSNSIWHQDKPMNEDNYLNQG